MNDKVSAKFFNKLVRVAAKKRIEPITGKDGKKFYPIWINSMWRRGSFERSMSEPTTELEAATTRLFGDLLGRGKITNYSGARMFIQ